MAVGVVNPRLHKKGVSRKSLQMEISLSLELYKKNIIKLLCTDFSVNILNILNN